MLLDIKQELQKFSHIDLKKMANNIDNIPDNIKNSVVLYNKALDNIHSKSEDIAIIELKKAISLNPDFHEAMNLLGICYTYIQDHEKASEMFERVIKAEKQSKEASRLLNSINAKEASLTGRETSKKSKTGNSVKKSVQAAERNKFIIKDSRNTNTNNKKITSMKTLSKKILSKFSGINKGDVPKLLVALILGALLVFVISLPSYIKDNSVDVSNTMEDNDRDKSELEIEINSLKKQMDEMNEKYNKLEKEKTDHEELIDYYKNAMKLYDIESLFSAQKYELAGDKLLLLKDTVFKDNEKKKFDELCNTVFTKAAWTVYNEGLSLFASKRYQDALGKLSKVQVYKGDATYMDSVLYNMGKCHKNLNDSRSALDVFQKIISTYPKSQYAQYAQTRINEITGRP